MRMQMWRTFVRTVLAKRKESGGLSKQFPNIHQTPALLIAGKPQIYGSFPEKELDITVAEFWRFFQKEGQSAGNIGGGHAGSAFAGIASGTVGTAYNRGAGSYNIRFADTGAGGAPAGIVNHSAAHNIDFSVIIRTAYGDYFPADAGSCDSSAAGTHISRCNDYNQPFVPGGINAPDEG